MTQHTIILEICVIGLGEDRLTQPRLFNPLLLRCGLTYILQIYQLKIPSIPFEMSCRIPS